MIRMEMTFTGALRGELVKMRRSALTGLHLVCGLSAALAAGAYLTGAPWSPTRGLDALVQAIGALTPLMCGIVCGMSADGERAAGALANLTAAPSRGRALAAKLCALVLQAASALALALVGAATILALRDGWAITGVAACGCAGVVLAVAPLYLLMFALALRYGRNVAVGVGAAGTLLSFFSVGGLAHGLVTGQLTGATPTPLGLVPLTWPARMGSQAAELIIAQTELPQMAGAIAGQAAFLALACLIALALGAAALTIWFRRFEEGRTHE